MAEESRTTEAVERDNNLYTRHRWILRRSIIDPSLIADHRSPSIFFPSPARNVAFRDHVPDPEMPILPKSSTFSTKRGCERLDRPVISEAADKTFAGDLTLSRSNRFELFRIFPCDGLFLLELEFRHQINGFPPPRHDRSTFRNCRRKFTNYLFKENCSRDNLV